MYLKIPLERFRGDGGMRKPNKIIITITFLKSVSSVSKTSGGEHVVIE